MKKIIKAHVIYDKVNKDIMRVHPSTYLALAMRSKPYGRLEVWECEIRIIKRIGKKKSTVKA